jgi:DNA-binding CsgD family transcriptional regulator
MIAEGKSLNEMAGIFGKNSDTFRSNRIKPLFKRLGANGTVHAVRRAYELGILSP